MTITAKFASLEEILDQWKPQLGADALGYKNHVYRMIHFCFALHPCSAEEQKKIIIAAAFHDLGIWANGTVDYLPPSIALANDYLQRNQLDAWIDEVALMIDMHHKLRAYGDPAYPLVEVFRRGDLVDFSLGVVRFGLPGALVREVKDAFPNAGFHKRLMQLAGGWFSKHPLSPPPFVKW
jgi:hypothetical protein